MFMLKFFILQHFLQRKISIYLIFPVNTVSEFRTHGQEEQQQLKNNKDDDAGRVDVSATHDDRRNASLVNTPSSGSHH